MGHIARPSIAPYIVAKSGLHGLTRALAVELGPKGVNVNCIGPGFYPGVQNEVVRRNKDFYDWIANRSPLGRWDEPAELGGAVIYFASPASSRAVSPSNPLLTLDNIIVSPHAICYTDECLRLLAEGAFIAARTFLHHHVPRHVVSPAVLDQPAMRAWLADS